MADLSIKVENVSKKFSRSLQKSMKYGVMDITRNVFGIKNKSEQLRKGEFWAVDNVSFELRRGDIMGLVGPNGSGKSTILKMLNGIFWPDRGKMILNGRVGALIEVGAGFHPLLTGRENIYINAAILGMTKAEVDESYKNIVEFADIGDFIDSPVKFYSSGMFVRLGFAVAVHCRPDILLVDEVLAVGDSNFFIKSLNKVNSLIKERNLSVIYVSHNNTMIQSVCNKALYIDKGVCKAVGNVNDVIQQYENDMIERQAEGITKGQRIVGSDIGEITSVVFLNVDGEKKDTFRIGEKMCVRSYIWSKTRIQRPIVQIVIFNEKGVCLINQTSSADKKEFNQISGRSFIDFIIDSVPFNSGIYTLSVKLMDGSMINTLDYHKEAYRFRVDGAGKSGFNGQFYIEARWETRDG